MATSTRAARIAAIAALNDPRGRRLYDAVSARGEAMSRDDAAAATGIPRSTAAFHLEKLVEAGLLSLAFRPSGRGGPGSGRPAKVYAISEVDTAVAIPDRRYDLVGDLLASAIERSGETGEAVRESLTTVAVDRGHELAEGAGDVLELLADLGYEPVEREGEVILSNCPFHRLAQDHTELICHANLALVTAAAGAGHVVRFDPAQGRCCVTLATAAQ
jgi:predicted ArsR family transcriptional regulator